MKDFEYDEQKSISNLSKHGIDFEDAQKLWMDDYHIEVKVQFVEEPRYIVVGLIDDKIWTAAITYCDNLIRIISVRRSRKAEVALYES
mgnify:CR=1 FL=1